MAGREIFRVGRTRLVVAGSVVIGFEIGLLPDITALAIATTADVIVIVVWWRWCQRRSVEN